MAPVSRRKQTATPGKPSQPRYNLRAKTVFTKSVSTSPSPELLAFRTKSGTSLECDTSLGTSEGKEDQSDDDDEDISYGDADFSTDDDESEACGDERAASVIGDDNEQDQLSSHGDIDTKLQQLNDLFYDILQSNTKNPEKQAYALRRCREIVEAAADQHAVDEGVGIDIQEALRGDHRFSWSGAPPVNLVVEEKQLIAHKPVLPVYDDERDVERSVLCQTLFLATANCYRDCGHFKPIDREHDNKDMLVDFTRILCKALDKPGVENIKTFFNTWDPKMIDDHTTVTKLQLAAQQENHIILKQMFVHMANAFTLTTSEKASNAAFRHIMKVVLAWEWHTLRCKLYKAYKSGTDSALMEKLPIDTASRSKFATHDKILRSAIFAYMAERCSLNGSAFDECLVKAKNWNSSATSMCVVINNLGWSMAMMLPPKSIRMLERFGPKRTIYFTTLFRLFFSSKNLDAFSAIEGIGMQIAWLVMHKKPVPGTTRPDLRNVRSLAEMRSRLEDHEGLNLNESDYEIEKADLACLDPALDLERVFTAVEFPNAHVRAQLEQVLPHISTKEAGVSVDKQLEE